MVNVLLADRNGGYYFTPMKYRLNDIAEDRGVTLSENSNNSR